MLGLSGFSSLTSASKGTRRPTGLLMMPVRRSIATSRYLRSCLTGNTYIGQFKSNLRLAVALQDRRSHVQSNRDPFLRALLEADLPRVRRTILCLISRALQGNYLRRKMKALFRLVLATRHTKRTIYGEAWKTNAYLLGLID